MKQILTELNEEIDSNTMVVGDFRTLLSTIDWTFRQKIDIEAEGLNNAIEQIDITNIHRKFYPTASKMHILLKYTQNILQDRSLLGHKTIFNKFMKTKIIPHIFSNCNGMKLDIHNTRKLEIYIHIYGN